MKLRKKEMKKIFLLVLFFATLLAIVIPIQEVSNKFSNNVFFPLDEDSIALTLQIIGLVIILIATYRNGLADRWGSDKLLAELVNFEYIKHKINFSFKPNYTQSFSVLLLIFQILISTLLSFIPFLYPIIIGVYFGNDLMELINFTLCDTNNLLIIAFLTSVLTSIFYLSYYSYYLTFYDKMCINFYPNDYKSDPKYMWAHTNFDTIVFENSVVTFYKNNIKKRQIKGVKINLSEMNDLSIKLEKFGIMVDSISGKRTQNK